MRNRLWGVEGRKGAHRSPALGNVTPTIRCPVRRLGAGAFRPDRFILAPRVEGTPPRMRAGVRQCRRVCVVDFHDRHER